MKSLSRFPVRLAVFVATAHFLIYHAVMGAYLLLPPAQGAPDSSPFWVLFRVLSVLSWPADILSPLVMRFGWMFPPSAAIPVAFASIVWSFGACVLWLLVQRFIRWAPPEWLLRHTRRLAFVIACVLLSWLFFGPVCAFAGEFMFGIADIARYFPGEFFYSPLRLAVSAGLWAASIFAAYKFIFVPRHHVSPATS